MALIFLQRVVAALALIAGISFATPLGAGELAITAGSGTAGSVNGVGTEATFHGPLGVALTPGGGVLYVAEWQGTKIRKIVLDTSVVTTVATGFGHLYQLCMSLDGVILYIIDRGDNAVMAMDTSTNAVTTLATGFNSPNGMTISPTGLELYVCDEGNHYIYTVDVASKEVTTLVSTGLNIPHGLAASGDGLKLYVAERANQMIKAVSLATQEVYVVAGTGTSGSADGTGVGASFQNPVDVVLAPGDAMLYALDGGSSGRVRIVVLATGKVTTLGGSEYVPGWGYISSSGYSISDAYQMTITADGSTLHIPAYGGQQVLALGTGDYYSPPAPSPAPTTTPKPTAMNAVTLGNFPALFSASFPALFSAEQAASFPALFSAEQAASFPTLFPAALEAYLEANGKVLTDSPAGTCINGSSTVTVLAEDGRRLSLPISQIKVGQKILALTKERKHVFSKVLGLPKSPSVGDFIKVKMMNSKHELTVTPHHTFPRCGQSHDASYEAAELKKGYCLHTTTGRDVVASVVRLPATKDDVTFTIELAESDLVAVGGIYTHTKVAKH